MIKTSARVDASERSDGAVPLRVLVVGGNADTTESMAMYLALEGHESRIALSGAEAYEIAATFVPQLVLIEVWLPDVDGSEVIRRLRAAPQTAGAMLVAITDSADMQARDCARQSGCDAQLYEPFDPGELSRIAERAVKRARWSENISRHDGKPY